MYLLILEREERRETERETEGGRNISVREKHHQLLPATPRWGSNPQTSGVREGTPTI